MKLNVLFAIPYFILYLYQNTTQQEITLNHLLSFCRECLIVCWLISTLGCTNFEKFNHQTQRSNFPKWQGQMSTFPKVHSAPAPSCSPPLPSSGSGSLWLWNCGYQHHYQRPTPGYLQISSLTASDGALKFIEYFSGHSYFSPFNGVSVFLSSITRLLISSI